MGPKLNDWCLCALHSLIPFQGWATNKLPWPMKVFSNSFSWRTTMRPLHNGNICTRWQHQERLRQLTSVESDLSIWMLGEKKPGANSIDMTSFYRYDLTQPSSINFWVSLRLGKIFPKIASRRYCRWSEKKYMADLIEMYGICGLLNGVQQFPPQTSGENAPLMTQGFDFWLTRLLLVSLEACPLKYQACWDSKFLEKSQ